MIPACVLRGTERPSFVFGGDVFVIFVAGCCRVSPLLVVVVVIVVVGCDICCWLPLLLVVIFVAGLHSRFDSV